VRLQQDSGPHDGRSEVQPLPAHPSRFDGQPPPLVIIKAWPFAELLLEHLNFLLKVFDDLLLVAVEPTRWAEEQK
jgi:hypothetical protein